jgi:long-subunit acyl-CoA synthetase (AMP-forming)
VGAAGSDQLGEDDAERLGDGDVVVAEADEHGAVAGTVGTALPGVELTLAGDGELLVRGPTVMKGYHNDPAKTADAVDPHGWLQTGDIATIDADELRADHRPQERPDHQRGGQEHAPAQHRNRRASREPADRPGGRRRRPYVVALIVLDPDAAAAFAAHHGASNASAAALATHPAIHAAIGTAVKTANGKLSRVEQIKRFTILPAFWEPGGDEITPTMKLKRRPITAKYAEVIDSMYTTTAQPA